MQKSSLHILMTGAGAPGAPGILKCLEQERSWQVSVADADENSSGRWLKFRGAPVEFSAIPKGDDQTFTDSLLAHCIAKKIDIVLPLVTKELIPLAAAYHQFADRGIRVLISPLHALQIANDKGKLYQFLEWRGIDVPAYRIVETPEQFAQAASDLGFPQRTFCFKPVASNGSRGFRIIDPYLNEPDLLFLQKPGAPYITYEEAIRIFHISKIPELLVSEYLPGQECSVDCIARHGEMIIAVPRTREKIINGISVRGTFFRDEALISYCRSIIAALQLHGNIGIQVKANAEGKYLLLEINPRVQGTISAALIAGINLPALAIQQETGMLPDINELTVRWGSSFARYWTELGD